MYAVNDESLLLRIWACRSLIEGLRTRSGLIHRSLVSPPNFENIIKMCFRGYGKFTFLKN